MASNNKLKILIVDGHDIVRKGLAMLVSRQADLFVVAEAGTAAEAVEKARASNPDGVIMDIRLPDGSGKNCARGPRIPRDGGCAQSERFHLPRRRRAEPDCAR